MRIPIRRPWRYATSSGQGDRCTEDLLNWPSTLDGVRIIERAQSVDERRVIDALVRFSSSLESMKYGGGIPPSRRDREIMDEVLAAVGSMSDALAERFVLPAVHMEPPPRDQVDQPRRKGKQRRRKGKQPPRDEKTVEERWKRLTWKPLGRLWTAPLVEPASAWAFWCRENEPPMAWERQLRYESPPRASRVVVDSLASADELIGENSFEELAGRLADSGIKRIDFSWRCVLEAECSAIRGERDSARFPCELGTESSLWLAAPVLIGEAPVPTDAEILPVLE